MPIANARSVGAVMDAHSTLPRATAGGATLANAATIYRPEIDGLRALAVVAVIIHHFSRDVLPSGYLGVDVFFVISGYVITGSLAAHSDDSLLTFLRVFYVRRVKRILPALVLCVLLTGLAITAIDRTPGNALLTGVAALFGVSNISLAFEETDYFARPTDLNVFAQTWSLGVEEQFYLVFPLLFWLGLQPRRFGGTRAYLVVLSLLSLASLLAFILGTSSAAAQLTYFAMPSRFWELAAGALLFSLLHGPARRIGALPAALAPVFLTVALALLFAPRQYQALNAIAVVAATLGLLASTRTGSGTHSVLSHPAVVYVGKISYSLYLWHWSVLSLSRWTIGIHAWTIPLQVLAIAALSVLSYTFVERPLRHAAWAGTTWRTIVAGILASTACAVLILGAAVSRENLGLQAITAGKFPANHLPLLGSGASFGNCALGPGHEALAEGTFDLCTAPAPTAGAPMIWALGDSHAGHLQGLLYAVYGQAGMGVHLIETVATPFPTLPGRPSAARQRIFETILERLRPGDIVLVARLMLSRTGDPVPVQGLDEWTASLGELADNMGRRGVNVVVMGPSPMFDFDIVDACVLFDPCTISRARLAEQVDKVLGTLRLTASSRRNLFVFDSFEVLCPPGIGVCSATRDGVPLMRDQDHLNARGAAALSADFLRFLQQNRLYTPVATSRNVRDPA